MSPIHDNYDKHSSIPTWCLFISRLTTKWSLNTPFAQANLRTHFLYLSFCAINNFYLLRSIFITWYSRKHTRRTQLASQNDCVQMQVRSMALVVDKRQINPKSRLDEKKEMNRFRAHCTTRDVICTLKCIIIYPTSFHRQPSTGNADVNSVDGRVDPWQWLERFFFSRPNSYAAKVPVPSTGIISLWIHMTKGKK